MNIVLPAEDNPCTIRAGQGRNSSMQHKLISGDNHIDLTYCPADLWSSQAPAKWKKNGAARRGAQRRPALVRRRQGPRHVERRRPGLPALHQGLVRPYRRDEGRSASSGTPTPAPSRGRPRRSCASPISTATGSTKEIIYGCLMVNDLIDDADLRIWVNAALQRLGRRLRQALRPQPRLPAGDHPQHRSRRRPRPRCGAAPRWG